jgi:hypothetical protein
MLICVCLRILASSRIPRYDLGRQTPHFEVVLSHPFLGLVVACFLMKIGYVPWINLVVVDHFPVGVSY